MINRNPGSTLLAAIELWRKMSVPSRTAFVKWLAADTSVVLFTQAEVDQKIEQALTTQSREFALQVARGIVVHPLEETRE